MRELERLAANNAHDRAAGQIPGADVLATLKRQTTDFEQGLQELQLLTRGRFIGHVISVRQRALLILASGVQLMARGVPVRYSHVRTLDVAFYGCRHYRTEPKVAFTNVRLDRDRRCLRAVGLHGLNRRRLLCVGAFLRRSSTSTFVC